MTERESLFSFRDARAELERLQGQQEAIEKVIGPTKRGESIRVVLAEVDALRLSMERIDYVLTTVEGDNVPQGYSCKLHARNIARESLGRPHVEVSNMGNRTSLRCRGS